MNRTRIPRAAGELAARLHAVGIERTPRQVADWAAEVARFSPLYTKGMETLDTGVSRVLAAAVHCDQRFELCRYDMKLEGFPWSL